MNRISQPSPAMVVAVLALVAALVGTALAANPTAHTSALSNKKVKKIATNESSKYFQAHIGDASVARAATADTAATADALSTQRKINYEASAGSPSQQILSLGNLRLTATCGAPSAAQPPSQPGVGPTLALVAETTVNNATINSYGNHVVVEDDNFNIGEATDMILESSSEATQGQRADEERDVVYTAPGGQVIVLQYAVDERGSAGCIVKGIAQIL